MKWSIKIGRFAGIDVFMHFTFILLISWVAMVHWRQGQSLSAAMAGVFFIMNVLHGSGCLLNHRYVSSISLLARFGW